MATQYLRRGDAIGGGQSQKRGANSVRIGSDNQLYIGTGTSGVAEKSTQELKSTVYTADGAIAVESHVAFIEKGSAAAMTLAAPTRDGIVIDIVAGTSWAHVVTATNLLWAGETGGPFNKVTTAAFIGSAARLISRNGLWLVASDQIATVGD